MIKLKKGITVYINGIGFKGEVPDKFKSQVPKEAIFKDEMQKPKNAAKDKK